MNIGKQHGGQFLLVVTYGGSGSILLQQMLNTLEAYLVKGKDSNLLSGHFSAYQKLVETPGRGTKPGVNKPDKTSYDLDKLTEKRFFEHVRLFVEQSLFPELGEGLQYRCLGFEDTRGFDLLREHGVQALDDYMGFLMRLFPKCQFIFLSRDHRQVMSSSAWAQHRHPSTLPDELEMFDQWANEYCLLRQDKRFNIDYLDILEMNPRLGEMFQFLNEKPETQKSERTQEVAHGSSAEFVKTRYSGLISQANFLYEASHHKEATKGFDKAVEYGIRHQLPQRIVCTQRSSYKDYYVIAMDDPAIAYFPISKCACSTIKAWLMYIDHTRRTAPGIHQSLAIDVDPHNYWGYDSDLNLDKYQYHRKFAVVRDPLERFVSFYTNFLDRISRGWFCDDNSCAAYISLTTDINDFVDYFCAQPIHHYYILQHTMPQHTSLSDAFTSLDKIFTMGELGNVQTFLEDTCEMALPVIQQNASHPKHKNSPAVGLNNASIEKLMRYYAEDYQFLENYFDPLEAADSLVN